MSIEMQASNTPRSVGEWFRHTLSTRFNAYVKFDVDEESVRGRWGGSAE